jgi:hypothetical protein
LLVYSVKLFYSIIFRTSTYQRGFVGGSAATRLNPWNKGTSPVYGHWDDDAEKYRTEQFLLIIGEIQNRTVLK